MQAEHDIRRWRLILGGQQNDGTGFSVKASAVQKAACKAGMPACDRRAHNTVQPGGIR